MKAKRQIESSLNSVTMLDGTGGHVKQTQALRDMVGRGMRDGRATEALLRCQRAANAFAEHRDRHGC